MRVHRICVRNVLGIREVDFAPGRVTEVRGPNGSGKTSLLEAIRAVSKGGHDATLLRQGEQEGEVVLAFDGDEGAIEVRKRIRADGSTLSVEHAESGKVPAAKAWVDAHLDAAALNPAAFLAAAPKDRVAMLLRALPATLDGARLVAIAGAWIPGVSKLSGPALPILESVRADLYERRRKANVDARDGRTAVEQIRKGLPASVHEDPGAALADAKAARLAASEAYDAARVAADQEETAAIAAATKAYEIAVRIAGNERDAAIEAARKAAREAHAAVDAAHQPTLHAAAVAVAKLDAARLEHAKAAGARAQLGTMEATAAAREAEGARLSTAIDLLDVLKAEVVAGLPAGLALVDGELVVGGIPFDRCSTAERVKIAFALALPGAAARGGLVLVDGAECLDAESLAALEAEARQRPEIRLIVALVDDGPLRITDATVAPQDRRPGEGTTLVP